MKRGFTLPEVMIANLVLLILVAGFAGITEQIFEQKQLRKHKAEIASRLDLWTVSKRDSTQNAGIYKENISWPGTNAELNWQFLPKEQNLITIHFQVKTSDATPKVLAEWQTAFYAP